MQTIILKPNGPAAEVYSPADRVADAILGLLWFRNVASYEDWPSIMAGYRQGGAS